MTDSETNLAHQNILIPMLLTTSEQSTQQDTIADLFIFLLRYSFMLNDATNTKNSCDQKTPQFPTPQGNIYMGARYLDPKYSRWISVDPALGEYVPHAPVNDEAKKHNQNLPGMGGLFNSVNGNLYHYAGNNPVKYVDPDGKFLDTFLDIVGILWDVVEIAAEPANPWSWASLAADVGCLFIPGATGGGKVIKLTEGTRKMGKVSRVAKTAGAADAFVDAIKDGEKIYGKYKDLKKVTGGYKHTIEAHHLIPQSKKVSAVLGKNIDDYASVVLDKATHKKYTDRWNPLLVELEKITDRDELKERLLKEIKNIYSDSPELYEVSKKWLETF